MPQILRSQLLNTLPAEWPRDVFPEIQHRVQTDGRKVVVLDDDPTGTQTVHDVPVLTEWTLEILKAELSNDLACFYVLTNSRALPLREAEVLNTLIGERLMQAAREMHCELVVVSRSDSTLRGHYPGEVDALAAALGGRFDATLIIPSFIPGGRHTINDVHYVAGVRDSDIWLTPAGETEFAKDKAFGYVNSNLREWVEEKTHGQVRAGDVVTITLKDIREGGPDWVCERLLALRNRAGSSSHNHSHVCIINAASDQDLAVAVLGILQAESAGAKFLFRTAASFVPLRAGIAPKPLLQREDLLPATHHSTAGGLIVVGSYVPKTSGQLAALLNLGVRGIEVQVSQLLDDAGREGEIRRAIVQTNASLELGEDTVLYTSRELVAGSDAASSLAVGQRISNSLVSMVRGLSAVPRYVLAKGGITSSDVATQALGVRRALVLGQVLAGVPVWQLGPETKYPNVPYIVFPGNVGGEQALAEVVAMLR